MHSMEGFVRSFVQIPNFSQVSVISVTCFYQSLIKILKIIVYSNKLVKNLIENSLEYILLKTPHI